MAITLKINLFMTIVAFISILILISWAVIGLLSNITELIEDRKKGISISKSAIISMILSIFITIGIISVGVFIIKWIW